jgi:DNA-binding beta-propeller fold protein YncE
MLVRICHDHTGSFDRAIDKVNTVETEVADNDYALGLIVQTLAASPFAKDTLVFVVEDDAQDGPDHVDAHRSIALVAGPFVKHGVVVSQRYTTVNLLRTIEEVLGLEPLGLNDALAAPMTAIFDTAAVDWSFTAKVPAVLRSTELPLPPLKLGERACAATPRRSSAYWAAAMAGQDFDREDHLDTAAFNVALWRGLAGDAPYPAIRDGRDLSQGRSPPPRAPECGA